METDQRSPDALLLERARRLDREAFRQLVDRHIPKLRRLVSRIVDNSPDQDEAMQNALLSAWTNLSKFEGRAQFSSWMFRVATNSALMVRRARKSGGTPMGDCQDLAAITPTAGSGPLCPIGSCWVDRPDEALQRAEMRHFLERKVVELPSLLREIFLLRYVDELSIKACVERLGISEAAVKTRAHRACLELRAAIHQSEAESAACRHHSIPRLAWHRRLRRTGPPELAVGREEESGP